MSVQYISDDSGRTTAVVIPIEDWNQIKKQHPDIEKMEHELPQWQKDALDKEILAMEDNPGYLLKWDDVKNRLLNC